MSVEEARSRILAAFRPLPAETVPVSAALGRVLVDDASARLTHPPADVSAMDGYAIRASDTTNAPATLTVIGEAPAGQVFAETLEPGQAVRIFTGGALPKGADTVAIQEDVERLEDQIIVRESIDAGTYVRPAGLDFRAGEALVPAGRPLLIFWPVRDCRESPLWPGPRP